MSNHKQCLNFLGDAEWKKIVRKISYLNPLLGFLLHIGLWVFVSLFGEGGDMYTPSSGKHNFHTWLKLKLTLGMPLDRRSGLMMSLLIILSRHPCVFYSPESIFADVSSICKSTSSVNFFCQGGLLVKVSSSTTSTITDEISLPL